MTQPLSNENPDADALFCPACRYDLRTTESGRCPECGQTFDRATLAVSRIPWVHRRTRGRIKTWLATVAMALRRPGELATEAARPVEWIDASRFRWTVICILTLLITASLAGMYPLLDVRQNFRMDRALDGRGTPQPGVFWWYPVFALWTGPEILAVAAIGSFAGLAAVSWWLRLWFWSLARQGKDRASAISCYLMARAIHVIILALLDLLTIVIIANYRETISARLDLFWPQIAFGILNLAALLFILAGLITALQRSTQRSGTASAAAAIAISVGAIVIFAACAIVVSYVLGFTAMAVYSICS